MRTRVCELLGVEHPIIQAGMGSFTNANLVLASCAAGILGSLGSATRPTADLMQQIDQIQEHTNSPFAVNFPVSDLNAEAFQHALDARVPVVSFALADPGELVARAHSAGALVIQQVHSAAQGYQAAERGADLIIAQGGEAGGYGQYVSTMALVPQVVDAVRPVPVVAAGGIADGRGIAAAFMLGAEGVNIGTRFLASVEAPIANGWKQAILAARSEDTLKYDFFNHILPKMGMNGYGTVPRGLPTTFVKHWTAHLDDVDAHADALRDELVQAVMENRAHEYVAMAGQTVGLIREVLPVAEIVRRLVAETEQALELGTTLARQGR